jgi:hypothetical protein
MSLRPICAFRDTCNRLLKQCPAAGYTVRQLPGMCVCQDVALASAWMSPSGDGTRDLYADQAMSLPIPRI